MKKSNSRVVQAYCAVNCLQHAHKCGQGTVINKLGSYQVQHVSHAVQRDSSTITLTELKLHLFLVVFHWLKAITDEGGEEAVKTYSVVQKIPPTKTHTFTYRLRLEATLHSSGRRLLVK